MNQSPQESSNQSAHLSSVDKRCDALIDALLKAPAKTHEATITFSARTLARLRQENATHTDAPLTVEAIEKILFNPNRVNPSPNFTASVLEKIHAENTQASHTRSSSFWRMAGTFAVAAALLMAVGVYVQQQPKSTPTPAVAKAQAPAATIMEPQQPAVASVAPEAPSSPVLAADWSTALAVAEARESTNFTFASAQGILPNGATYHGYRPQTGIISTVGSSPVATQSRPMADPALVNALLLADGLNNARPLLDSDTMQALVVLSR